MHFERPVPAVTCGDQAPAVLHFGCGKRALLIPRREAEALAGEARSRLEEYVAGRTRLAEQKIAQAEAQALQEVRALSADVAQWALIVLTAYFGGRSLEKVARILGRK